MAICAIFWHYLLFTSLFDTIFVRYARTGAIMFSLLNALIQRVLDGIIDVAVFESHLVKFTLKTDI